MAIFVAYVLLATIHDPLYPDCSFDSYQANIFINTGDGTDNNIVIGDFGLSICVDAASNMLNSTRSGSERYLAPEQSMPHLTDEEIKKRAAFYGVPTRFISHSNRPTTQTDLFSFAMLCIEVRLALTTWCSALTRALELL